MAAFINLEDSPMFHKQVRSLEQTSDELRDRCQKLYKGCKKYTEVLGVAFQCEMDFAASLEAFGGGIDDLLSVSIGGPVLSKFINGLRELATYKEFLRSQVEHVLVGRLSQFLSFDLQDTKWWYDSSMTLCEEKWVEEQIMQVKLMLSGEEQVLWWPLGPQAATRGGGTTSTTVLGALFVECRRRFDKAIYAYDQAREKFASLKKTAKDEVVAELEEDLHNSKSAFERSRFNMVNSLMNIEAKKKFEFLECFSAIMDAHLRYFKLGHDLLGQMEPFIHQVLTCALQSKEQAMIEQDKLAKRIQEFRTQSELNHLQACGKLPTSNAIGMNGFGMSAYKSTEAIMLAASKGEVSCFRYDWPLTGYDRIELIRRRYFTLHVKYKKVVCGSWGYFSYSITDVNKVQTIKQGYLLKRSSSLRADWKRRFFVLDSHGTLYYYRNKGAQPGGSPSFNSFHSLEHNNRVFSRFRSRQHQVSSLGEDSLGCSTVDLRTSTIKIDAEDTDLRLCFRIISPSKTYTLQAETEADRIDWMSKITGVIASLLNSRLQQFDLENKNNSRDYDLGGTSVRQALVSNKNAPDDMRENQADSVSKILREVPGNDQCAECSAPDPDWASLNLGILMCIECSGIHRNLGVHISKVRSVTLDVRVWEPTVLNLFQALGNSYCNSVWEELLPLHTDLIIESEAPSFAKPRPNDAITRKEKYIQAKYVRKLLVNREGRGPGDLLSSTIWEAVRANNLREVYRICVASLDENIVNSSCDEKSRTCYNNEEENLNQSCDGDAGNGLEECSLLHLACHCGSLMMMELLLQLGADINKCDLKGRTPLQHCILSRNNEKAKFLLRRGARASIKDAGGFSALERAMEMGAITDDELFILLAESE
ncbi:Arf-GAP with GTPase [Striga asiatica]|uniref:Arf-GAP with GTPase n=1 Tax=Striga asiatica TaxID=4170 RepID=A0A5A7RFB5_STRAF|nr:Arf-GAP with GTPase [Striga asiatica]